MWCVINFIVNHNIRTSTTGWSIGHGNCASFFFNTIVLQRLIQCMTDEYQSSNVY